MKRPRRLLWSLGLSAWMGLMAGEARAGSLTEVLSWYNTVTMTTDTLSISGGPYATVTTTSSGTSLTLNLTVVNSYLASHGSYLQFGAGSGASSNQAVIVSGEIANLTSNGTLFVTPVTHAHPTGSTAMTITVYQTDWSVPTGHNGVLENSGSATFTETASGNTETFNSWFNSSNVGAPTGTAAGLQTYTAAYSPMNPTVDSPLGSPAYYTSIGGLTVGPALYALSNQTVVSLTQENINGENGQYQVTTTLSAVVPEPASIVMTLTGMPFVIVAMLRRRAKLAG